MYRLVVVALTMLALSTLTACGGYHQSSMDRKGNFQSTNYSLLSPSISPVEHGRGMILASQAELNQAMADKVRAGQVNGGNTVVGTGVTGVIENRSTKWPMHIYHPEMGYAIEVMPQTHIFMTTTNMPSKFDYRVADRDEIYTVQVSPKNGVYRTMPIAYGLWLNK